MQLIMNYFVNIASNFVLNYYLNHLLLLIFSSFVILPPQIDYVAYKYANAFRVLNALIFLSNVSIWNVERCSVTAFTSLEIS